MEESKTQALKREEICISKLLSFALKFYQDEENLKAFEIWKERKKSNQNI